MDFHYFRPEKDYASISAMKTWFELCAKLGHAMPSSAPPQTDNDRYALVLKMNIPPQRSIIDIRRRAGIKTTRLQPCHPILDPEDCVLVHGSELGEPNTTRGADSMQFPLGTHVFREVADKNAEDWLDSLQYEGQIRRRVREYWLRLSREVLPDVIKMIVCALCFDPLGGTYVPPPLQRILDKIEDTCTSYNVHAFLADAWRLKYTENESGKGKDFLPFIVQATINGYREEAKFREAAWLLHQEEGPLDPHLQSLVWLLEHATQKEFSLLVDLHESNLENEARAVLRTGCASDNIVVYQYQPAMRKEAEMVENQRGSEAPRRERAAARTNGQEQRHTTSPARASKKFSQTLPSILAASTANNKTAKVQEFYAEARARKERRRPINSAEAERITPELETVLPRSASPPFPSRSAAPPGTQRIRSSQSSQHLSGSGSIRSSSSGASSGTATPSPQQAPEPRGIAISVNGVRKKRASKPRGQSYNQMMRKLVLG